MKKTNKSAIILFVLLVLVAVSAMYVASTYAKYTSTVTANGKTTVAKWAFTDDNSSLDTTLTIDTPATIDASTLVDGKIAPGTSGKFIISLSNRTSEVGVEFTINLGTVTNKPTNLVINNGTTTLSGKIAQGGTFNVEIPWTWAYESGSDDVDTQDGEAAKIMNITATIVGTQVQPGAAITTGLD